MNIKNLYFAVFVFLIYSCKGQTSKNIESIAPKEFSEKLNATKNPQILDVRTKEEFAGEHLENAKNENWNDSNFDFNVKKYDKTKAVFVYCLSGGRSKKAAEKLISLGFLKVYELQGGIMKWNAAKLSKPSDKTIGMTMQDYNKLLISDKKVLISFYADWCAPCKKMTPYILKMQKELSDTVVVIRLNADENKTVVQELKIDALPTLILYQNQTVKSRKSGFISENDLRKIIK